MFLRHVSSCLVFKVHGSTYLVAPSSTTGIQPKRASRRTHQRGKATQQLVALSSQKKTGKANRLLHNLHVRRRPLQQLLHSSL